jgi:hypothetical protein
MLRGFRARSDARWKPLRGHLPMLGRDARESLGMSIFPCLDGKPPGPHGQPQSDTANTPAAGWQRCGRHMGRVYCTGQSELKLSICILSAIRSWNMAAVVCTPLSLYASNRKYRTCLPQQYESDFYHSYIIGLVPRYIKWHMHITSYDSYHMSRHICT